MRFECEGGTVAWLAGACGAKCSETQEFCAFAQELWPYQRFVFKPLVAGNQKVSLASLSPWRCPFRHLEGSLAWDPSLLVSASSI